MIEEASIKKAIMEYYHEGHVQYRPELYDEILHDEWKFFYFNREGNLEIVDKRAYKSWYEPEKIEEGLEWKTEFLYVDVTGNNAAVKLKIGNQKVQYTDYFNMLKIEGKWWIVNKISTAERFE
ncbi:MAG: nuclear transport factor 2 family protein [Candidatus Thorarchaeota archaeon]|nr:MAG: nuclear transport factor 2 family protein [Candidatus Thorarchaeota archaeon]